MGCCALDKRVREIFEEMLATNKMYPKRMEELRELKEVDAMRVELQDYYNSNPISMNELGREVGIGNNPATLTDFLKDRRLTSPKTLVRIRIFLDNKKNSETSPEDIDV